jgi:hypothetical protein
MQGAQNLLALLKQRREEAKELSNIIDDLQTDALDALAQVDPDDDGVIYEYNGQQFEAHRQQNGARWDWDLEDLVPFLRAINLFDRVTVQVVDNAKVEAEIKSGSLSAKELDQYKIEGDPPAPFVRSIRYDPTSLRNTRRRRVVRRKRQK